MFPPISTISPGTSLKFRGFSFVSNGFGGIAVECRSEQELAQVGTKKPPIRPHQRPLKGDQVDKAIELSKDSPVVVQGKNTGFDVYVRLSDFTIQ